MNPASASSEVQSTSSEFTVSTSNDLSLSSENESLSLESVSGDQKSSYTYFEHPEIQINKVFPKKIKFIDRAGDGNISTDNPDDIIIITDLIDQINISSIEADESDYEFGGEKKPMYSVEYYQSEDDAAPLYVVNLSPVSVDVEGEKGKAFKSENLYEIEVKLFKEIAKAINRKYASSSG